MSARASVTLILEGGNVLMIVLSLTCYTAIIRNEMRDNSFFLPFLFLLLSRVCVYTGTAHSDDLWVTRKHSVGPHPSHPRDPPTISPGKQENTFFLSNSKNKIKDFFHQLTPSHPNPHIVQLNFLGSPKFFLFLFLTVRHKRFLWPMPPLLLPLRPLI